MRPTDNINLSHLLSLTSHVSLPHTTDLPLGLPVTDDHHDCVRLLFILSVPLFTAIQGIVDSGVGTLSQDSGVHFRVSNPEKRKLEFDKRWTQHLKCYI